MLLHTLTQQDGTLVKHRGDFAADSNDWSWLNERVVPTLQKLHDRGFRLVVFRRATDRGPAWIDTNTWHAASCVCAEVARAALCLCSNQNGIKTALDGKKATTVKGYFDNAFRSVRL